MKIIFVLFLILCGCASRMNSVPDDSNKKGSFEYCGGTLWGYVVPIGPRQDKSWWTKDFNDPMPRMAVYLHMHSMLEKDPKHALALQIALRTREDLSIQIPNSTVTVQIDKKETKFKFDFIVTEAALRPDQIYTGPEYDFKLIDGKDNKWQVTRKNKFFYLIKEEVREEIFPSDKTQKLSSAPVNVKLDKKHYGEVYLLSEENIWPANEDLKNATISITTPQMIVNGTTYEPRKFTFEMNYDKVKKRVGDSDYVRCPSTEMIFFHNN